MIISVICKGVTMQNEYLLVNKQTGIIEEIASNRENLSKKKRIGLDLDIYESNSAALVGDFYNKETNKIEVRLENRTQPTAQELIRKKISECIREMAIAKLKEEGKIPQDYKDDI